ncbi:MAG: hypothetical protein AAFN44_17175 [Pseudomonadota bacterium]
MSSVKNWIAVLIAAQSLPAIATEGLRLTETMAVCAGRMSAEMEFAWLRSDPEADRLEEQRRRFVEILEALGPATNAMEQLAMRIDAKMAHAGLLTTAQFGTDKARSAWAKRHAVLQRKTCQNMLLES